MNDKQKSFLCDLAKLCEQYAIDCIYIEDNRIVFRSRGDTLQFGSYSVDAKSNSFRGIHTTILNYEVKCKE